jgi:hypothetical protein
MKCCMCEADAVVSFGVTKEAADRYKQAKRTYYAYGHRETLLVFCEGHFEEAALTWPGLASHPLQPVNRHKFKGASAISRVRAKLEDPETRRQVMMLWRQAGIADERQSLARESPSRRRSGRERTVRLLAQVRELLAKG